MHSQDRPGCLGRALPWLLVIVLAGGIGIALVRCRPLSFRVARAEAIAEEHRAIAEHIGAEAQKQREIAEQAMQEAYRQREVAERARQLAEEQRAEAERQRNLADQARQEAERRSAAGRQGASEPMSSDP